MHERDTATETEFNTVLQMTVEHDLTQRFKQSTKWTAKVINIIKYVWMWQKEETPLEGYFSLKFICHETLKYLQISRKLFRSVEFSRYKADGENFS